MNIEALRSFLEAAECGSFSLAAARIGVTQSTVSSRIQGLEEAVGRPLFTRGRHGAELTAAGHDLRQHGLQIVQTWDQARQELALPPSYHGTFGMGGPVGLYDTILMRWVSWMKRRSPGIAIRLDEGSSDTLSEGLASGRIDAAVMYLPRQRPGLRTEVLFEEQLVLASHPSLGREWRANYAFVDWGSEFRANHARAFPDLPTPGVTVRLGALGLRYVLSLEGAAYLPLRMIEADLAAGRLVRAPDAPAFRQPVFLVHPAEPGDGDLLALALSGLREVTSDTSEP